MRTRIGRQIAEVIPISDRAASPRAVARRPRNADVRPREHLLPDEAAAVIEAAGNVGRYRHRDRTMMLMAYRHGFRVGELVRILWADMDMSAGTIHCRRLKGSEDSTHPLNGAELRAIRRLKREQEATGKLGRFVFVTERCGPITEDAVRKITSRAGERAGIGFPIHPHMLRHARGYRLAAEGIDTRAIAHYLGHRNLENCAKYTALSPTRFQSFPDD